MGVRGPRAQLRPRPRPTPMRQANSCVKSPRKIARTRCLPTLAWLTRKRRRSRLWRLRKKVNLWETVRETCGCLSPRAPCVRGIFVPLVSPGFAPRDRSQVRRACRPQVQTPACRVCGATPFPPQVLGAGAGSGGEPPAPPACSGSREGDAFPRAASREASAGTEVTGKPGGPRLLPAPEAPPQECCFGVLLSVLDFCPAILSHDGGGAP